MITVQFGVHKSASTFCTQLIQACLQEAGIPVTYLPMQKLDAEFFSAYGHLENNSQAAVLVKSHGRLTHPIRERIETDRVSVFATYRDPRDAILSSMDAAPIERQAGKSNRMASIQSLDDAINVIRHDYDIFFRWTAFHNVTCISYDILAEYPTFAINKIAERLGLNVSSAAILEKFSDPSRIRRFNKGVANRFRNELTEAEQKRIMKSFRDYTEFIGDTTNTV